MAKLASKTYGEALYDLAVEENKVDELFEEGLAILDIMKKNSDFDKLMKHPKISKREKAEMIKNVFGGRVSNEMIGFLEIVIQKERYGELESILNYFIVQIRELKKIGTAYITTAFELTEIQKAETSDRLLKTTSYESIDIIYDVNKDIIGGMIIRIKDRIIDSSIRTKLDKLKKQLLQIQLG